MNIDLTQFFEQFEGLEADNVGQWPKAAKITLAVFIAIVVLVLGYFLLISDKITTLDNYAAEEVTLKSQYQIKYHVAANLELFEQQMKEAEALFANQLRSLPESHETPGLLDDITFVGTTSGLKFVKLNWQPEITREIYIELPIDIEVVGSYHEFGNFVSKIAGLPRIVTLHDFDVDINNMENGLLGLKLQAKTYRYREAEEK
ncbi:MULTISPECIES: type 4a pilus biogenesis protein PilO [unclassified Colwellia]|jgi:type IV pilus assembly protein PilO|uniref:type 4a pilus biogenesis protein PilO n=1 Tax=unclassified Colwellia TaxID=196834 RepID=UPI0015F76977|nr:MULTISPECIES: type 4a pilus biogenesis protein PilO [unclassified Colwellia]MBA6362609.1 type 4a pilus biogenesis protein PilO [Colwellia sp. BRX8-8]MBA6336777.1 type 4a pilus biogenesis protein PilO [Colwellia sp. BRX8-7]MBA6349564.1 type 4a pilus biogenesis protein PilO [Colwellia sp. BRX8-9]MBA6351535.1 type 4a pilus biogenesis protein PilO [Colwellia sp. BRX9-1]MBA6354767.1 type 4a pilus biogenesis protein PilO [Colwellia sp. BRX8-3]|tara:strand:- start:1031 stop:1639 length:609 start_codon:yes stop_codon:yes gene_type:complete